MSDYAIPKNGAAYIFYGSLVSQANTKLFQSAPTLAAGDFKVSIDGGAFANLATLPTNTPGTFSVKFSLSGTEMTGDNILVVASDVAGAEWCDQNWNIQTSARGIADLAYPATTGRSMVVDAAGLVDANMVKAGASGAGNTITTSGGVTLPAATLASASLGSRAYATGTQTAVISTEHFVSSPNVKGVYSLHVDTNAMVSGDTLEIRVYQMVLTAGTQRVVMKQSFTGLQPTDDKIKITDPIGNDLTDTNSLRFSITQTAGTGRAFPWKVMTY